MDSGWTPGRMKKKEDMNGLGNVLGGTFVWGLLIGLLSLGTVHGQLYMDREGVVVFEASEKLFEPVKARNGSVSVLFDPSDNSLASLALMRGFRFENSLMQEHFNENYIESDLYPRARFKGILMDFDLDLADRTTREYVLEGSLEIRGVEKEIQPRVKVQKIGNILSIQGSITLLPKDFKIEIPKIVENKIAKEVVVKFDFKLRGDEGH